MLTEENDRLLYSLVSHEYDTMIEISLLDGQAQTLFTRGQRWKKTLGAPYDYARVVQQYILDVSADSNPHDILSRLRLEQLEIALEKNASCKVHYTTHGSGGSIRLHEISCFLRDQEHMILLERDITDSFRTVAGNVEHLEKALRSAEKEAAQRNAFLNLMSRNIRTPLYSIMGLTHIASHSPEDALDRDDYLRKISMSGSYMTDSIDDILELRQLAAHEIRLAPETIHLDRLLNDVRRAVEPVIQEKRLILTFQTDTVVTRSFIADPHCLTQILKKLLKSAVSYAVEGGRIQLSVRELFRSRDNVTLEFSVESKGIMIDQERLTTLFRPYDQLQESIDENIGDIDISLMILKRYLQEMNTNTLTAETVEGKGTRIAVTLTLERPEEEVQEKPVQRILPDLIGKRVLLVDDNHISLEIGRHLLLPRGAFVATAGNGREAIDLFRKENGRFDLIFMDILMPEMDGLTATREIRAMKDIPGAATVPIIAMTANAFRRNFEESFRAGMNAHLVKPIEPERFYEIIDKLLRH